MKLRRRQRTRNAVEMPRRKRVRAGAARPPAPERPTRIWSLLLPPTFPSDRP